MPEDKKIQKFISKNNLKEILRQLSQTERLIAPQQSYGEILFQDVTSADNIVFDYDNCLNSPKDFLFFNEQLLFEYFLSPRISVKRQLLAKGKQKQKEMVIFGSRACDTRAVELLDKFFYRKYPDDIYQKQRNKLLIITLVCKKQKEDCFCVSTHSGPYLNQGFDLQLIDIGNGYFMEACSQRGNKILSRFAQLISEVDVKKIKEKEKAVEAALKSKHSEFDFEKVFERLDKTQVKDELWQDVALRCQSCGGCLLICPTCSCYYVKDSRINRREGKRVRNLDTCYYEGFTRLAGGLNPFSEKKIMVQRKFYHKLWQQVKEFSQIGCTGCGRCNHICPGNVHWLNVIKRIEKASS